MLADTAMNPEDGDYVVCVLPEHGVAGMRYREQDGEKWLECDDGRVDLDKCILKGVIVEKTVKMK